MAFINIIEPEEASGDLLKIYDKLKTQRGKLAQIHKIQSLNPDTIMKHMDLYMSIMFSNSPLSRARREMMAVVVSAANSCGYCQLHHGEALHHYWKNRDSITQLRQDFEKLDLGTVDKQLCRLARKLTRQPGCIEENEDIEPLKSGGLTDRAILDAVLVISYFNFANRMVMGLGVEPDAEEARGYHY